MTAELYPVKLSITGTDEDISILLDIFSLVQNIMRNVSYLLFTGIAQV